MADVATSDLPDDLSELRLEDLRRLRAERKAVEDGMSYLRRMAQGRLDVVAAEQARRDGGAAAGDDEGRARLDDLLQRLPSLLSSSTRSPNSNRPPQKLEPGDLDAELVDRLDHIAAVRRLEAFDELSDEELWEAEADLTEFEREVSDRRRGLFVDLDRLDAELTRRYRTGEASVDDLFA